MLVDEPVVSFTAFDRCDKCGAQACAQAELAEPKLLFCGHCIREFSDALLSQGFSIRWDETKNYLH